MTVYVYSRSSPVGVPITSQPDREERSDTLAEAWTAIYNNWDNYQYMIHSIYDASGGKTFSRAEIDQEIKSRRATVP